MRIPISIVCVALTALLGMEAWTLNEIVDLKVSVAALSARVTELQPVKRIALNP